MERSKGARIAYLPQVDVFPAEATVEGSLLAALADLPMEEYERTVRAKKMLRRLGFEDGATLVANLSGGWKKRLAIGCQLVQGAAPPPDGRADEPSRSRGDRLAGALSRTGEPRLRRHHPRPLLPRTDGRPDRGAQLPLQGRLLLEQGPLQRLPGEAGGVPRGGRRRAPRTRDRKSAARSSGSAADPRRARPRPRSRIDEAQEKIERLSEAKRRQRATRELEIDFAASGRRTHDLITAEGIAKTLGGRLLFRELDVHLRRGGRLGIVGNNASGKTTLLRTLAGAVPPDAGRVKHATDLRIALFDQQRDQLDKTERLRRALSPSGDTVSYLGRETHIFAWAKRFGFRADQLDTPVGDLSGGEQARVLMALMIREPADVLLLDEPTNDLDISSIEVLERALEEFPGAVVLITHDRHMLDRICTDLIGLHGDGRWANYGSVAQWQEADARRAESSEAQRPRDRNRSVSPEARPKRPGSPSPRSGSGKGWKAGSPRPRKRSRGCEAGLDDPAVATDHEKLQAAFEAHRAAQEKVNQLYARWEELERKTDRIGARRWLVSKTGLRWAAVLQASLARVSRVNGRARPQARGTSPNTGQPTRAKPSARSDAPARRAPRRSRERTRPRRRGPCRR